MTRLLNIFSGALTLGMALFFCWAAAKAPNVVISYFCMLLAFLAIIDGVRHIGGEYDH